jgi:triosephosphate isomerase
MNGSIAAIDGLLDAIVGGFVPGAGEMMVFPPSIYLDRVVTRLAGTPIVVGAQNVHVAADGAFTGEIAAEMVRDLGATHVLVGHSERRALFGETDQVVAEKFAAVRRAGLTPVLCAGESLDERNEGRAESRVLEQLQAVLDSVGVAAFAGAIVAYEPVWAIGTGRTATPGDAQAMHAVIRGHVAKADAAIGAALPILYGGSVKADNAQELFAQTDVNGGLVGGASLDASQFLGIYKAID